MTKKSKNYPLIPEEERKCTWMIAGFVTYKLCDRNYRCDICPFELAIKSEVSGEGDFQEPEEDWTEGSQGSDPSVWINGSVFYHPDHCWVQVESPEEVRIGIDTLLTQLIADVKVVILPQVGSFTEEGECCAHIIQSDYILPVISPLSGSVQTVNLRLINEPERITDAPREEGWLLTIKPNHLECDLKKLLFGRKALLWYRREEKAIIARTESAMKYHSEAVGPTMQDGGVRIGRLKDMLNNVTSGQKTKILDFFITGQRN